MYYVAIQRIRHGGLRRWSVHGDANKLHPEYAERLNQISDALDAASPLVDLAEPTYRLHPLRGIAGGSGPCVWTALGGSCSVPRAKICLM